MSEGSCMCGAVRFRAGPATQQVICHCKPCQKSTGTSASYNLFVDRGSFQWLQGADATKTFVRAGDSGQRVTYVMCQHCPGVLRVEPEAIPGVYIVKLGNIDDAATLRGYEPAVEIYTRNRFPSFAAPKALPQHEGPPPM